MSMHNPGHAMSGCAAGMEDSEVLAQLWQEGQLTVVNLKPVAHAYMIKNLQAHEDRMVEALQPDDGEETPDV